MGVPEGAKMGAIGGLVGGKDETATYQHRRIIFSFCDFSAPPHLAAAARR